MPQPFDLSKRFPGRELPFKLNFQFNRLVSFDKCKGIPSGVRVSLLAKQGFYYEGVEGLLRCDFCNLVCCFQEAADFHRLHSPSCHGLTNNVDVDLLTGPNIKIPDSKPQAHQELATLAKEFLKDHKVLTWGGGAQVSPESQQQLLENDVSVKPVERVLGVVLRDSEERQRRGLAAANAATSKLITLPTTIDGKALFTASPLQNDEANGHNGDSLHPDYMQEHRRQPTFRRFPWGERDASAQNLLVYQLVNGGFFFTGHLDVVICYCCGVGLYQWLAGDDPNIAHARWSPKCRHLHNLVSAAFLAAIRRENDVMPNSNN